MSTKNIRRTGLTACISILILFCVVGVAACNGESNLSNTDSTNNETTEQLAFQINSNLESYSVMGIGEVTDINIVIPSTYNDKPVIAVADNAFVDCIGIKNITIPDSVKSIGNSAFLGCSSITNIEIPNSCTSIGRYAFKDCSSLTSVIFGNGITRIDISAFVGSIITDITIPSSVTAFENYVYNTDVFETYKNIKNIYFNGNLTDWCKISFGVWANPLNDRTNLYLENDRLTEITVNTDISEITSFYNALSGCGSIEKIFYKGSIEEFFNMGNLEEISNKGDALFIGNEEKHDKLINIGLNSEIYYYSEFQPNYADGSIATASKFWHYIDGEIVIWE